MGTAYWYTGNADKALAAMEIVVEIPARTSADAVQPGMGALAGQAGSEGSHRGLAAIAQGESGLSAKAAGRAVHRQGERARFARLVILKSTALFHNRSYRRHGASYKEALFLSGINGRTS